MLKAAEPFKRNFKLDIYRYRTYSIIQFFIKKWKAGSKFDIFDTNDTIIEDINKYAFKTYYDFFSNKNGPSSKAKFVSPIDTIYLHPEYDDVWKKQGDWKYIPELSDSYYVEIDAETFPSFVYNAEEFSKIKSEKSKCLKVKKVIDGILNECFKDKETTFRSLAIFIRIAAERLFYVKNVPWTKEYFLNEKNIKKLRRIAIPFRLRHFQNKLVDTYMDFNLYISMIDIFYVTELLLLPKDIFISEYGNDVYEYYVGEKMDPIQQELICAHESVFIDTIGTFADETIKLMDLLRKSDPSMENYYTRYALIEKMVNGDKIDSASKLELSNLPDNKEMIDLAEKIAKLVKRTRKNLEKVFYFIVNDEEMNPKAKKINYFHYNEWICEKFPLAVDDDSPKYYIPYFKG